MSEDKISSEEGVDLREGDVFRYRSERDNMWCREGLAVVTQRRNGLVALDTFWEYDSGDRHVLTDVELATAREHWNLADYRQCERGDYWEDYAPEDRQLITSQHGLRRMLYVRIGAERHLPTRIENARERLASAESNLDHARWKVEHCQRDLEKLLAEVPS